MGHAEVILNPTSYDNKYFGYIKCKVLPPKKLYHPVLPIKDEKLRFVLCDKCFKEKIQICNHTEDERCLIGTWTTIEVDKSLEKGYKLIEIYEIHHFKNKSNNLFKNYVRDFMKIKLETSEFKQDYKSKEEYIENIKEKLNI